MPRQSILRSFFLVRLGSVASRYMDDYVMFYGSPMQKCEEDSTISNAPQMASSLELDLFSVPEGTAIHFLLYSLTSIAKMVNHNYLWLKGLLSIKVNLKYAHLLHILKHDLVPALQVEEKGFILRIPIISIHNWYQNQGNFSNPEIAQILSSFRCDFGLNAGRHNEAFHLASCLEAIGHRELRDLTVPCDRRELEMEEMERYIEEGRLALEEEERAKKVQGLNAKLSVLSRGCSLCCTIIG